MKKTLLAALFAIGLIAPAVAAEPLTSDQMDQVTAGDYPFVFDFSQLPTNSFVVTVSQVTTVSGENAVASNTYSVTITQ